MKLYRVKARSVGVDSVAYSVYYIQANSIEDAISEAKDRILSDGTNMNVESVTKEADVVYTASSM